MGRVGNHQVLLRASISIIFFYTWRHSQFVLVFSYAPPVKWEINFSQRCRLQNLVKVLVQLIEESRVKSKDKIRSFVDNQLQNWQPKTRLKLKYLYRIEVMNRSKTYTRKCTLAVFFCYQQSLSYDSPCTGNCFCFSNNMHKLQFDSTLSQKEL